jgi:hypothetical protein
VYSLLPIGQGQGRIFHIEYFLPPPPSSQWYKGSKYIVTSISRIGHGHSRLFHMVHGRSVIVGVGFLFKSSVSCWHVHWNFPNLLGWKGRGKLKTSIFLERLGRGWVGFSTWSASFLPHPRPSVKRLEILSGIGRGWVGFSIWSTSFPRPAGEKAGTKNCHFLPSFYPAHCKQNV